MEKMFKDEAEQIFNGLTETLPCGTLVQLGVLLYREMASRLKVPIGFRGKP